MLIIQLLHGAHEATGKEFFGDIEALQFVHGLHLLFAFGASIVQRLVLLLYQANLPLYLRVPLVMGLLLALLILQLELTDLRELAFLFDLKDSLLSGLSEQYIQDGLHLIVEVEEIIVVDLRNFIDTRLLWHILGRWRFRQEHICLCLDSVLLGCVAPLLRQEVGQVDLNAGRRTRSQVIGLGLRL